MESLPERWLPLPAGAVQVWRLQARPDATDGVLTPGERERAGRMRAGRPREEFVTARVALRVLLGRVLGIRPELVKFAVGEHGKPELAEGSGVWFNVAHARGGVLVALSGAGPVGVDVERLDRTVEVEDLARAHFQGAEAAAIVAGATEAARAELFFRCWTRKEAVVKADGRGLQMPLASFSVLPLTPARELAVGIGREEEWFVSDLLLGDGFCGALAVSQRDIPVQLYDFDHTWTGSREDSRTEDSLRG